MRLLFDQNLAPGLVRRLSGLFPDSDHTETIGFGTAPDFIIWEYDRKHGFTIVTKDKDFADFATRRGHPPKVVSLRLGNCSVDAVARLLRDKSIQIHEFEVDPGPALLVLP